MPKMRQKRAEKKKIYFMFKFQIKIKYCKNYKTNLKFPVLYGMFLLKGTFFLLDPDPYGDRCGSRIRIHIITNAAPHRCEFLKLHL